MAAALMGPAMASAAPELAKAAPSVIHGFTVIVGIIAAVIVILVIIIVVAVKTKSGYFSVASSPTPVLGGETWGKTNLKFGNYTTWG